MKRNVKANVGFKIDKTKKNHRWTQTLASRYINSNQAQIAQLQNVFFKNGKSFLLQNGDNCQIYDWILVQAPDSVIIGQVLEILQIYQKGSKRTNATSNSRRYICLY